MLLFHHRLLFQEKVFAKMNLIYDFDFYKTIQENHYHQNTHPAFHQYPLPPRNQSYSR